MIDGETLPGETDGRTTSGRRGADEDRGWSGLVLLMGLLVGR